MNYSQTGASAKRGDRSIRDRVAIVTLLALAILSLESNEGQAAEDATGWYALGSKTSKAGFVPPPGTYLTDVNYYYQGDAKGKTAIAMALRGIGPKNANGTLIADVDFMAEGQVYYNLPSVLWVAPGKVLGGMSASAPLSRSVGRRSVSTPMLWRP